MGTIRGKSLKAVAFDIAEGYTIVNPIFLKPVEHEDLKGLLDEIQKAQQDIRTEKFPRHDTAAIRWRNLKLQRLHSATMIIKNFARERRLKLF